MLKAPSDFAARDTVVPQFRRRRPWSSPFLYTCTSSLEFSLLCMLMLLLQGSSEIVIAPKFKEQNVELRRTGAKLRTSRKGPETVAVAE